MPDLVCAHCGAVAVSRCVRCKSAFYCRRKCQKFHWSRGGHKQRCAPVTSAAGTHAEAQERAAFDTPANRHEVWKAATKGAGPVLSSLIARGAGVNWRDPQFGSTALYTAAYQGHSVCVRLLLDAGADKEVMSTVDCTPLFVAAGNGHDAVVRMLLDAGADKDRRGANGTTPLFVAAEKGHEVSVRMLIKAGADKERAQNEGCTPLCVAAESGHDRVVRALLAAGADKDRQTNNGWSPLLFAASEGHGAVARTLIDAGADKDHANQDGCTPLLFAAQGRHDAIALMLLDAGADKNLATTADGVAPLFMAAQMGSAAVVRALLDAGADLSKKTRDGRTALDAAMNSPTTTPEVGELIMQAIAAQAVAVGYQPDDLQGLAGFVEPFVGSDA